MKKVIKKTKEYTYSLVPELVSASDLQRKSGKILQMLKDSTQPYFIVKNNKPTGVIVGIEEYNRLKKMQNKMELKEVLKIISDGENELKTNKVKELKSSIHDLWKNLQGDKND
ncbi:MAG: Prevent-host-death family protein [Candidatus Roizmanbacteria bacterium GW2011_GWA2_32_13]|uniref:Antitoxin n=1 Tax=Candidatus Roizmanbacteria bacterium GW2011_GWA2_32_13 TaxID=1618475 RepID=A0A0F9ZEC4_9BACT|nr:MAG: Prevent-host-death family protein [Candidatus Roizmanbacteria bacterium GW2011_GWA2_32_13]